MKKRWSILLTANLLSALVSPLMVHAVTPTTESEEILKNISQSSQTYARESIEQSDMIKQTLKSIQETYDTQSTSETTSESTTDTTNMELSEESTQEKDSDSSNENEPNPAQQRNRTDNKIAARSADVTQIADVETNTGTWGTVSWVFNENTGTLTFTSGGNLGKASTSPWNTRKVNNLAINKIVFSEIVKAPENSSYLFSGNTLGNNQDYPLSACRSIKGIENIDVSKVKNMSSMFSRAINLRGLDLSSWNTKNVTNVTLMFQSAFGNFETDEYEIALNVSSFRITSNLEGKNSMFLDAKFNKITVGKQFDLRPLFVGSSYGDFPAFLKWYNKDKVVVGSSTTGLGNTFLNYLAEGHPGTYTTYLPDNPPTVKLTWGDVPYQFDEKNGVLTFIDGGTFTESDESPWNRDDEHQIDAKDIKKIVFTEKVTAPKNSQFLFSRASDPVGRGQLSNLAEIEHFDYLNTSKSANMEGFFLGVSSLTSLDVSHFNTSNVTNMKSMFKGMTGISSLNLGNFDFSKVTSKKDMFSNDLLKEITLPATFFDKTNSTNLNKVSTTDGYNGNWVNINDKSKKLGQTLEFLENTAGKAGTYVWGEKSEDMLRWGTVPYQFDESTGELTFTDSGTLGEADKSPWNRPDDKVINATKIKKIVFTKPVNAPENSKDLFSSSGTGKDYLSNVTSIEHLNYLNTSKVTSMDSFFSGLSSIKTLDLSKFDTRNVTTMHGMFYINKSISSLNLNYALFDTSKVSKMSDMFNGMSTLNNLDISNFKTKTVQDFGGMFKDVSSLTNLNLSQFDMSSATDMSKMFNGMKNLKALNVSSFNTSNVTSMNSMFNGASSLTDLSVKNFDTKNVTNMTSMFQGVKSLKSIDVSSFNTGKVTSMKEMFRGMTGISSLNLGNFDFTKVISKLNMFAEDNIKEITLPKTFSDVGNSTGLNDVSTKDGYNGNWVNINDKSKKLGQTEDFLKNTAGKAGTYIWGEKSEDMLRWGTVPYQFDESTGVLTFVKGGTLENSKEHPGGYANSPWNRNDTNKIDASKIKEIVFTEPTSTPVNSALLFSSNATKLTNLTKISGLENLDTSKTTNMLQMFNGMSGIKELDLSHFKTNNVINMSSMFYGMSSLESLNVSSFDTSNVNDMSSTFANLKSLIKLDISSFDTKNVNNMSQMFNNDSAMTRLTIDNKKFNTAKVKTMDNMFNNMSSLESLDTSKFDTSSVTTMASMFRNVRKVSALNLSHFNTAKVTNMSNLFAGMTGISALNLGSFDFTNVSDKNGMFSGDALKEITLPATFSDPKNTTKLNKVSTTDGYNGQWQNSEGKLFGQTKEFLQNYNGITDAGTYTWGQYLKWGDVPYEFNESTGVLTFYKNGDNILGTYGNSPWNRPEYRIEASNIKEIVFTEPVNAPSDSQYLFSSPSETENQRLKNVTKITGLDKLNTSNTTDMTYMFGFMNSLTQLDVSKLDTSKATKMYCMFVNLFNIEELNVSGFDTSNVTDMFGMFYQNRKLKHLDVSGFDTSRVTTMEGMFADNESLEEIDVSHFNTSNVNNMACMFENNKSLTKLNVSNFDTSNVTVMRRMFNGVSGLSTLDVSKFNTQNVTNMLEMFRDLSGISSLDLGSFDFTNVSDKNGMFSGDELKEITLPSTFSDVSNSTKLNDVSTTDGYNGNWVNIDNKNVNLGQTPDFLKNTAGKAGTYIWGRQSALHLVKVPDLYDFGNKNSIKDIIQILKPQSTGKQEVEIRDDREQKDIWSLSVKASKLESDKLDDLDQARYQFSITSASDTNVPIQGITYSDKQVVLPADNSSHVLYSMTDKTQIPTSYNTWINDMSLIVSQNSGKPNEHYSGTITWSLDTTPQD
ncbi:BspA family leucine-rich repeat surface protein [Vagococcus bubulae]|uniref:WxL domain-containing protein n=1 Tax=Vagococcus bubulae TaxID=1977868 RepID=A0A429ZN83_9ENTE|nr:BspA family leucine-rich repeat surface protein [Vagococcus bubulae]RST95109.1 hypothetical protein CBF36_04360 [Vagococcus bubulae]